MNERGASWTDICGSCGETVISTWILVGCWLSGCGHQAWIVQDSHTHPKESS